MGVQSVCSNFPLQWWWCIKFCLPMVCSCIFAVCSCALHHARRGSAGSAYSNRRKIIRGKRSRGNRPDRFWEAWKVRQNNSSVRWMVNTCIPRRRTPTPKHPQEGPHLLHEESLIRREFKGQQKWGNRTESLWGEICLWEGLWEGVMVFRDFWEVFRGFQRFLRGFQSFLRGFQRSSQRPSQRQISSQRLSFLLPLIVLPLELSPIDVAFTASFGSPPRQPPQSPQSHPRHPKWPIAARPATV